MCVHVLQPYGHAGHGPLPTPAPRTNPQLLRAGRTVVAAVRSEDKARAAFSELGLKEGYEAAGPGSGALVIAGGVDVTQEASITPDLFIGISQVGCGCLALGQHACTSQTRRGICSYAAPRCGQVHQARVHTQQFKITS